MRGMQILNKLIGNWNCKLVGFCGVLINEGTSFNEVLINYFVEAGIT